MSVPDYQTLMLPVLRLAKDGETSISHCVEKIAKEFSLNEEDLEELLPSGKQSVIANRAHWAKFYLVKAGLLKPTRRGYFEVADRGRTALAQGLDRIDNKYLDQFEEFRVFRAKSTPTNGGSNGSRVAPTETATPVEQIETAYEMLTEQLKSELLERILAARPEFFEQTIVDLMMAMGYGGATDAGKRLGRSGDGGIDGLINEDVLGLDSIYLQAKRYAPDNTIGVEKIREFAGSLDERSAVKGVFVTTSRFAQGARDYAARSPKKLVLIDGDELTRLLVRYGVGVRTTRTIELKKLDFDYFDVDDSSGVGAG